MNERLDYRPMMDRSLESQQRRAHKLNQDLSCHARAIDELSGAEQDAELSEPGVRDIEKQRLLLMNLRLPVTVEPYVAHVGARVAMEVFVRAYRNREVDMNVLLVAMQYWNTCMTEMVRVTDARAVDSRAQIECRCFFEDWRNEKTLQRPGAAGGLVTVNRARSQNPWQSMYALQFLSAEMNSATKRRKTWRTGIAGQDLAYVLYVRMPVVCLSLATKMYSYETDGEPYLDFDNFINVADFEYNIMQWMWCDMSFCFSFLNLPREKRGLDHQELSAFIRNSAKQSYKELESLVLHVMRWDLEMITEVDLMHEFLETLTVEPGFARCLTAGGVISGPGFGNTVLKEFQLKVEHAIQLLMLLRSVKYQKDDVFEIARHHHQIAFGKQAFHVSTATSRMDLVIAASVWVLKVWFRYATNEDLRQRVFNFARQTPGLRVLGFKGRNLVVCLDRAPQEAMVWLLMRRCWAVECIQYHWRHLRWKTCRRQKQRRATPGNTG